MRRAASVIAAAALVLTACPAEEEASPRQAVVDAVDETIEQETSRVAMSFDHEADGVSMTLSGEGVIDFVGDAAELRIQFPGMAGEEGAVTTIVVEDAVYTQMPLPGAGGRWLRLDLDEAAGVAGVETGTVGEQNPADTLRQLHGLDDDVTEEGREEVRGVEATRYAGTIDPERALEQLPEGEREQARESLAALGPEEVPVVVWVGDDGLLRRVRYELNLSEVEGSERPEADGDVPMPPSEGTVTTTIELFDFGVDADVTPPPDDEVMDFSDLELPGMETPAAP